MLSGVFYWLFNMSIVATLTGIVVLLLRLIKKIPRRVIAVLWVIPFIRMWVPFGIGGRYGLMTFLSKFTVKTIPVPKTVPVLEVNPRVVFTQTNMAQVAKTYDPITYKVDLVGDVFAVASVVWAVIAAGLFLTLTFLYFFTMRELKNSKHLYDNVYASNQVTSPAVYGIFRPKIILPAWMTGHPDLEYILRHERTHIRRLDNFRRVLAFASAALHWFNPFSWIFLKCFLSDLEVACDETVLQKCSESEKKQYALALVSGAEKRTVFISAFGGARIRTRVERILSYRKMTAVSATAFTALIAAIAYFLLTNAY